MYHWDLFLLQFGVKRKLISLGNVDFVSLLSVPEQDLVVLFADVNLTKSSMIIRKHIHKLWPAEHGRGLFDTTVNIYHVAVTTVGLLYQTWLNISHCVLWLK